MAKHFFKKYKDAFTGLPDYKSPGVQLPLQEANKAKFVPHQQNLTSAEKLAAAWKKHKQEIAGIKQKPVEAFENAVVYEPGATWTVPNGDTIGIVWTDDQVSAANYTNNKTLEHKKALEQTLFFVGNMHSLSATSSNFAQLLNKVGSYSSGVKLEWLNDQWLPSAAPMTVEGANAVNNGPTG